MGTNAVIQLIFAVFAILHKGAAISATTAGRMPLKIASTAGLSLKSWKSIAIVKMIINDGKTAPNTVAMTPRHPYTRQPMNTAELTAMSPGAACANAIILRNSSSSIQCLLSTTSFCISGSIAYPPPSVKVPILRYVQNSSTNSFKAVIEVSFTYKYCGNGY